MLCWGVKFSAFITFYNFIITHGVFVITVIMAFCIRDFP